jgi:drug/metabolite transporter (DMT)-like permease
MATVATLTVPRQHLLLPPSSQGPLLYWVLVVSILGYCILTSATRFLVASHVAAYISVQPLAGAVLGRLAFREQLHAWDCGALFIILGLFLVADDGSAAAVNAAESLQIIDRMA